MQIEQTKKSSFFKGEKRDKWYDAEKDCGCTANGMIRYAISVSVNVNVCVKVCICVTVSE